MNVTHKAEPGDVPKASVNEPTTFFGPLNYAMAHMLPEMFASKAQRDLARCGKSHPLSYENYRAIRNFLFCAASILSALSYLAVMDQPHLARRFAIAGCVAVLLLPALPRVLISFWGEGRARRVSSGLPDGLDLIAMAMSGGLSLQQALDHAAAELATTHADLSHEFGLMGRQTRASSIEFAFRRFGQRMDWPEIRTTLDSLVHAIQVGSSLRLTLEQMADRLRSERLRRATDRANKNVIKMLFPLVLCLAPAAMILILMPPLLKLREFREQGNKDGGVLSQRAVTQQADRAASAIEP